MFSMYFISNAGAVSNRLANAEPTLYGAFNHVEQWDIDAVKQKGIVHGYIVCTSRGGGFIAGGVRGQQGTAPSGEKPGGAVS
jgi:hypothetical protein